MCLLSSSNLIHLLQFRISKKKKISSWSPATRFYGVHYFCFHSKSSHLLSPLGWGAIWFWLLSACSSSLLMCLWSYLAVCWMCSWYSPKRKAHNVMSHSHGFFAEDLTLMSNPCALCVLRKDVKSLGTEWSHPEVSAIGTIVPEVFSHTEESLSHEGPQPSQCCYSSEEQPRFLGPALYCILSRDGNKRNKRKKAHQPPD